MKKLTWISTPTELFCASSRRLALKLAPEGALLLSHDAAANKPASIPFATVRNGKAVPT